MIINLTGRKRVIFYEHVKDSCKHLKHVKHSRKQMGSICPVSNEGQALVRAHHAESKSVRANAQS